MTELEREQRAAVVREARSWIRTPYHPRGRMKGVGVDCAMLPAEVYAAVGLIPRVDPDHYPPDWHLHRSEERYLSVVLAHAREVPEPTGPGDLVLWKVGHCFAHGAIVLDWPLCAHAVLHSGVELVDGETGLLGPHAFAGRDRKFFTLW